MSTSHGSMSGGTAGSLGDLQGLMMLRRSAGALALDGAMQVPLPSVQAPSLEGLSVEVPAPQPVTREDLLERFEVLCREHAARRERAPGEEVALGDDVLLDVLGYADGRLIPFSARANWWTEVAPEPLLPGFFEALVGAHVGLSVGVELTLPETYAVEALRGVTARFLIDVKAARAVTPGDALSPEFVARLGLGSTIKDVLQRIAEEIAEERAVGARRELQEAVLDALVQRTEVELAPNLIDEEIRHRWVQQEYPVLLEKNFTAEELEEAWQGWRTDALTRLDAEWRLRVALALQAIATRDRIQPTLAEAKALYDSIAESTGVPPEAMEQLFDSTPAVAQRFENLVLHAAALDHVLSKVELTATAP